MGYSSLLTLLLIFITTILAAKIQHSVAAYDPEDYINAHNNYRQQEGVPPVSWDDNLASYARDYASKQHGDCLPLIASGGPYGENLFWGKGKRYTPYDAVDAWMSQKQYYNYGDNSCADGEQCESYLRVVWGTTKTIGCASVLCDEDAVYMICEYYPPENIWKERPY